MITYSARALNGPLFHVLMNLFFAGPAPASLASYQSIMSFIAEASFEFSLPTPSLIAVLHNIK
jgi:hypothetical protein